MDHFLPRRKAYAYHLDANEAPTNCFGSDMEHWAVAYRPQVVLRPKSDCPRVQETMMGVVDTAVLDKISRVMAYIAEHRHKGGGSKRSKKDAKAIREILGLAALPETEIIHKREEKQQQQGKSAPPTTATAAAHPPPPPLTVEDEDDIFGDAGTDYMCEVERRPAKEILKKRDDDGALATGFLATLEKVVSRDEGLEAHTEPIPEAPTFSEPTLSPRVPHGDGGGTEKWRRRDKDEIRAEFLAMEQGLDYGDAYGIDVTGGEQFGGLGQYLEEEREGGDRKVEDGADGKGGGLRGDGREKGKIPGHAHQKHAQRAHERKLDKDMVAIEKQMKQSGKFEGHESAFVDGSKKNKGGEWGADDDTGGGRRHKRLKL